MNELVHVAVLSSDKGAPKLFVMRKAGSESYALPSGTIRPGEDPRVAAARVLLEETGVLLARDTGQADTFEMMTFPAMRKKIRAGEDPTSVLRTAGLTWATDALMPWSHWLTPSIEAVRTTSRIFVAIVPGGMKPTTSNDPGETGEWLTTTEAAAHAHRLQLAPMLLRTCWELGEHPSADAAMASARTRAEEPFPILPRLAPFAGSMVVLLPWDPDYETAGQGESKPFAYQPKWARGPSRFVLEDRTWKHVELGSTRTS